MVDPDVIAGHNSVFLSDAARLDGSACGGDKGGGLIGVRHGMSHATLHDPVESQFGKEQDTS
jgi:hypothetical protein